MENTKLNSEKIEKKKEPKVKTEKGMGKRFGWELASLVLEKCYSILQNQKFPKRFANLSDLIKKSLRAYQNKEIDLKIPLHNSGIRKQISVRLDVDLTNFYQTIPMGQHRDLIELSLVNYLALWESSKK